MTADEQGAPAPAAAFGEPHHRRPSTGGYWLGGAIAVAAVLGAVLWVVTGFNSFARAVDDLQRVPVPGEEVVTLQEGRQSVYYEGPGGEDAPVPALRISLRDASSGTPVEVGSHGGRVTYSAGGHSGRSVAGVRIERAGDYVLAASSPASLPPTAELAIGEGLGGRIVGLVLGGLGIFFGGLLLAGAVIALTAVRRSRAG